MKTIRSVLLILFLYVPLTYSNQSVSGNSHEYKDICFQASKEDNAFQTFRSNPNYRQIVEFVDGHRFARYFLNHFSSLKEKIPDFLQLESVGSPILEFHPEIGYVSATTLRYMVVGAHINQVFSLSENPTIAEIGAGFGGQCYILSQIYTSRMNLKK